MLNALRKTLPSRPAITNTAALLAYHRALHGTARMEGEGGSGTGGDEGGAGGSGAGGTGTGGTGSGGGSGTDTGNGFPADTPLTEMTSEQREAYWKHQARKHENTAKSRADYDKVKAENERLIAEHGTEQEKAVNAAKAAAKAEALRDLAPELVAAKIEAVAAGRQVNGKPLDVAAIVDGIDAAKYLTDKGVVDTDKVTRFIDSIAPKVEDDGKGGNNGRRADLGQGRRGTTEQRKGAAGAAEADRRFATAKQ